MNNFFVPSHINKDYPLKYSNLEIHDFYKPETIIDKSKCDDICLRYNEKLKNYIGNKYLHAPFYGLNILSADKEIESISINRIRYSFEIASILNINNIIIHTGYIPIIKIIDYQKLAANKIINFINFLNDKFPEKTIYIENVWERDFILFDLIFEQYKYNNLSICLDVGHVNAFSSIDFNIPKWLNHYSDKIKHMHWHDNNGEWDFHNQIGNGTINWNKILHTINTKNINSTILLELFDEEKIKKSIEYLNKISK